MHERAMNQDTLCSEPLVMRDAAQTTLRNQSTPNRRIKIKIKKWPILNIGKTVDQLELSYFFLKGVYNVSITMECILAVSIKFIYSYHITQQIHCLAFTLEKWQLYLQTFTEAVFNTVENGEKTEIYIYIYTHTHTYTHTHIHTHTQENE